MLAVSDYQAGKVVATLPIGKGVDGTGFDPATGDIFASGADGTLTILHEDGPDQYHVLQTLTTPIGSRNLGVDPVTHRVFVVSAEFAPPPAGWWPTDSVAGDFYAAYDRARRRGAVERIP